MHAGFGALEGGVHKLCEEKVGRGREKHEINTVLYYKRGGVSYVIYGHTQNLIQH